VYTILSTFPPHGSGNVGDKLLQEQTRSLLAKEAGVEDFRVEFRTYDFSSTIDELNNSDAIVLPAFAIREPIYPDTYTLTERLEDIDAPIIPIAANWDHYPGDQIGNTKMQYSDQTVKFLRMLEKQPALSSLTTRDIYTKRILERHGFSDVTLVGDLGWYHDDYMGKSMRIPDTIDDIVMTTPHKPQYLPQAEKVMDMLISEFPCANITCSFHSTLLPHDQKLRKMANERGVDVSLASHDTSNISFYDSCDLHVGYRLHGHLSFLRRRLPSVLIGEDGRGNGFNATLGIAGFPAAERRYCHPITETIQKVGETKPGRGLRLVLRNRFNVARPHQQLTASVDMTLHEEIRNFLREEIERDFTGYEAVPELFDTTYENAMKPFLKNLP
jgi:hypothetical protein